MTKKTLDIKLHVFNENSKHFKNQFYKLFDNNYKQFNKNLNHNNIDDFLNEKESVTVFASYNDILIGTLTLVRSQNFSAFIQYFCVDKNYKESDLENILLEYLENFIINIKKNSKTVDDLTVFIYKDIKNDKITFDSIEKNGFIKLGITRKVENQTHILYGRVY